MDERRRCFEMQTLEAEATPRTNDMKTRKGVGADGWASPVLLCKMRREADARAEEALGEGISFFPQTSVPPVPESPQAILAQKRGTQSKSQARVAIAEMPEAGWPRVEFMHFGV
jgi:hypothetical protein